MPHLRRPQPVVELHAEGGFPAVVERRGKRLAGRGGETQRRQVGAGAGRRGGQFDHRRHHLRRVDEDRRAMPGDPVEEDLGRRVLGEQGRRAADRQREEQVRAGGVAEVELGHRQRDVVLRPAHGPLGVELGGVGEAAVGLHRCFRAPGRAAGEQPDGRVVPVGAGRFEFERTVEVRPVTVVGDDHPVAHGRRSSGRHDRHPGPGQLDHGRQPVRRQGRVDHDRHGPDLEDPEQRGGVLGRVGQRQDDPLLLADAEVAQQGPELAGQPVEFGVGQLPRRRAAAPPVPPGLR